MAREFDGTSNRISITHNALLNFASPDVIAITAIVKNDTLTGTDTILAKGDLGNPRNYQLRFLDASIEFAYRNSGDTAFHVWTSTKTDFATGTWYRIAMSYTIGTGTSFSLYVNDTNEGGSWTAGNGNDDMLTNALPMRIGILDTAPTHPFDGMIAEVRLYRNPGVTASTLANLQRGLRLWRRGLVAEYHLFGNVAAGPEPDTSGNDLEGSVSGPVYADHPPGIAAQWLGPSARRVQRVTAVTVSAPMFRGA